MSQLTPCLGRKTRSLTISIFFVFVILLRVISLFLYFRPCLLCLCLLYTCGIKLFFVGRCHDPHPGIMIIYIYYISLYKTWPFCICSRQNHTWLRHVGIPPACLGRLGRRQVCIGDRRCPFPGQIGS